MVQISRMFLVRSYEKSGCAQSERGAPGMLGEIVIIFGCGLIGTLGVFLMVWLLKRDCRKWKERF